MLNIASRWTDKLVRMPWATMLPLWLPMPFLLSGGVRSVTGWSLGASLVPCALLVVGAAVLSWFYSAPDLTVASGRIAALATFGSAAILVVWTFRLWWSPLYGGLPNTVWGVDVGNHAIIYQRFTGAEHAVYEGLVGLYSLMHWYRRTLGAGLSDTASIYYGLRFAHYTCLLTVPLAIALVAYPCVAKLRTTREQLLALVLALPFQLAVIAYLIFPVAGYYQAEGFYSQIAGIYPLMLGWLSFGLFENAALRFLICMFWIIAQRFTYGLNLGDLLITLAYAWLWEAPAIRVRWLRWGAWLFVPVGLAASYVVYTKLYPLRFAHGYFMNQSVPWVLGAQTLLSVALLAAPAALRAAEIGVSEPSLRMWRYAGTFGLVNSAVTAAYFGYDQPTEYYILKYSFYAILLVSAAAIGPIASVVAHAVSSEWRWWFRPASLRLLIGMLCVAAFASGAMMRGHLIYRRWRASGSSARSQRRPVLSFRASRRHLHQPDARAAKSRVRRLLRLLLAAHVLDECAAHAVLSGPRLSLQSSVRTR